MTLSELEQKLGYKFIKITLLEQALTHRSFGVIHNERLEFLGDSVLNCCIARLIFDQFPTMPEGELSRLRANLVNQAVLSELSANLEIGPLLRLGDGELKTGGAQRPSILGDALEAVLGAVVLDSEFSAASKVVRKLFSSRIETVQNSSPVKDAKTELQEWLQSKRSDLPEYKVKKIEGESHRQIFHVECSLIAFDVMSLGKGVSRRAAEQDAAAQALIVLYGDHTAHKAKG